MRGYRYLLNKIAWACLTVLFVIVLNFFLFRILPGDPARAGIRDPRMTVQAQEAIRVRFGLDKPVINCFESLNPLRLGKCAVNPLDTQFFIYIRNLFRGELGFSYHTNRPVIDMIAERLWNTVLLIGPAQILSIVLGMTLGLLAAWKAHTAIDYASLIGSLVAWSLPTFWLGILLLFWGSSKLGLPIGGKMTAGATFATTGEQWLDVARHLILPTLTFTIVYMGEYMLYHAQHGAGSVVRGLHPDGQGQGAENLPDPQGPCPAKRDAADGHHHRPESGLYRQRGDPDRDGVFLARPGAGNLRGAQPARLSDAAGACFCCWPSA